LRYANQREATVCSGHFEIVSLTATLSRDGVHAHICLADGEGRTFGGHVMRGCLVYTTAELVIGEATDVVFTRPIDPRTTYDELAVAPLVTADKTADAASPAPASGSVSLS
ncbi:DNA-binding protein, partial [archaeon]